jgi:hypothetical protein
LILARERLLYLGERHTTLSGHRQIRVIMLRQTIDPTQSYNDVDLPREVANGHCGSAATGNDRSISLRADTKHGRKFIRAAGEAEKKRFLAVYQITRAIVFVRFNGLGTQSRFKPLCELLGIEVHFGWDASPRS